MIKIKGSFSLPTETQLRFRSVKKEATLRLVWETESGLLATNEIGFAFSTTVRASSNGGAVTYTLISGNIPAGMSFNETTGALTGVPETAGTFEFSIRATSSGLSEDREFSLSITPITLAWTTAADLGTIQADSSLSQVFSATSSSGRAPIIEHVSGILPDGVRFEGSQLLGRAANLAGSFDFVLRARDGAVASLDRRFTLVVEADIVSWVSASNLGALDGATAFSRSLEATSSFGRALTYTISGGTLPSGLTLSQGGAISGTTGNGAGAFSFTVTASDGLASAARTFTGSIVPVTISWQTPGALPAVTGLSRLEQTFQARASNDGALTYSLVSGDLPAGISLVNGVLRGNLPNQASTNTFTIRASYNGGLVVADRVFTLTVNPAAITWGTPASLPTLRAGNTLAPFSATSPTGLPVSYEFVSGSLPGGLSFQTDGSVSGSAVNDGGSYTFTIRASDTDGLVSERTFTVVLDPDVVAFTTAADAYEATDGGYTIPALAATSHYGRPISFSLTSGALPAGVTLSSDGTFTGTPPNDASSYSFTVEATDGIATASRTFAMSLVRAVVTFDSNPPSYLGEVSASAYVEFMLSATTTSQRPVTYTLFSGSLPTGMSLLPSGVLGGTPTGSAAPYAFVVRASDGVASADRAFSFDLIVPPVWQTQSTLGILNQGDTLDQSLMAQPQVGDSVTYSVVTANGATRAAFTVPPPSPELAALTLSLSADGRLSGSIDSVDPQKPSWVTSSSTLAQFARGDAVNLSVKATAESGRTLVGYSVAGRRVLPAGMYMDPLTGNISGVADIYPSDMPRDVESFKPVPQWNTASGSLGTYFTSGPASAVSRTLSATPRLGTAIVSYAVIDGRLPIGATLNAAGVMSGTIDKNAVIDGSIILPPGPIWATTEGSLGTSKNGTAQSIALSANPTAGTTVKFVVVGGGLPRGLSLTTTNGSTGTGAITGTSDAGVANATLAANTLFNFTIRALGSDGGYTDRVFSYTLTV